MRFLAIFLLVIFQTGRVFIVVKDILILLPSGRKASINHGSVVSVDYVKGSMQYDDFHL